MDDIGQELLKAMPWINTYSGLRFDLIDPDESQICLADIAHALSNICRFTGHTEQFYSVAQHSVLVSQLCHPDHALDGLFHDATEAYLNDMSRPLKHDPLMADYRNIEAGVHAVLCEKYNLQREMPHSVKEADDRLVANEAHQLLPKMHPDWSFNDAINGLTIRPWSPLEAECRFYRRYLELTYA